MAMKYGDGMAQHVEDARLTVTTGAWTPLQVGADPLKGRRHLRIQILGPSGGALALAYANGVTENNARGVSSTTFTAPTGSAAGRPRIAGGQTVIEPIGDKVEVYGRLILKDGETGNSGQIIVTEYA